MVIKGVLTPWSILLHGSPYLNPHPPLLILSGEETNKRQQIRTENMAEETPELMEAIGLMMDRKLADVATAGDLKDLGEKLENTYNSSRMQ